MLVTVQGPEQRVELQLPAERPVAELLPLLVEVCAGGHQSEGARWELAPLGGLAYDGARTLQQVGVMDGSLLHLRDAAAPAMEIEGPGGPYDQPLYQPQPAAYEQPEYPGPAAYPVAGGPGAQGPYPSPPAGPYASPGGPYGLYAPPPEGPYPPPGPVPEVTLPQDRTRMVLPPRLSTLDRLGTSAHAAFRPAQPAAALPAYEPSPGQIVNPSSLMVQSNPGPITRMKAAWRATDYVSQLDEAIVAPQLRRCVTVAVMSPKGGVGKTTTTTLLGSLLALLRRDRIVAIDTNPDFGSLGRQLAPEHTVFVDDLYEVLDDPQLTATALDNHLGRAAHGLMVLPAPTDPVRVSRLDSDAYTRVVRKLQQMVGVIVLDTGTGLHEPAARAALATADQIILVSDSEPSTASLVAEAAALLRTDRVPIWLLINKSGLPTDLDLRAFGSVIPHARGLLEVRSDVAAARRVAGGRFRWHDAPGSWQRSVRELAASLVADWRDLGTAG